MSNKIDLPIIIGAVIGMLIRVAARFSVLTCYVYLAIKTLQYFGVTV